MVRELYYMVHMKLIDNACEILTRRDGSGLFACRSATRGSPAAIGKPREQAPAQQNGHNYRI